MGKWYHIISYLMGIIFCILKWMIHILILAICNSLLSHWRLFNSTARKPGLSFVVAFKLTRMGCPVQDESTRLFPDSKVDGANTGPTRVLSAPDEPHVGPMNIAIRVLMVLSYGMVLFLVQRPSVSALLLSGVAGISALGNFYIISSYTTLSKTRK